MTSTSGVHPFDQAIALQPETSDLFTGHFPEAYGNMVGPFGGVIAATLLNAVLSHPQRQGDPVSMTVNFAGPIADAGFEVVTRVSRTNRSTQHWTLELRQADSIAVTATVFLAIRRDSWEETEITLPEVPPAASVPPLDNSGYPQWVKQYDLRIVQGEFRPGTEASDDSVSRLWIRDRQPRPLDFCSLMAISDSFFPRIFIRRQERMPAGTVSLTTYFHADADLLAQQGERPLLAEARAQRYYRNYFDQVGKLWSENGALLATTHQIVYFKG